MSKKINFEEGLLKFEEIIQDLENPNLNLDKALNRFEEGVFLSKQLNETLKEAEKKVKLLSKDISGQPQTEDFELNNDSE